MNSLFYSTDRAFSYRIQREIPVPHKTNLFVSQLYLLWYLTIATLSFMKRKQKFSSKKIKSMWNSTRPIVLRVTAALKNRDDKVNTKIPQLKWVLIFQFEFISCVESSLIPIRLCFFSLSLVCYAFCLWAWAWECEKKITTLQMGLTTSPRESRLRPIDCVRPEMSANHCDAVCLNVCRHEMLQPMYCVVAGWMGRYISGNIRWLSVVCWLFFYCLAFGSIVRRLVWN